jgi:hypothetical protein
MNNKELHIFYFLLHVIKRIKSRKWDGNVTCEVEMRNMYRIFSWKTRKKVTTLETKEELEG